MIKIGIIAGSGKLPILIGKSLLKKNYKVTYFCIDNHANNELYNNYDKENISLLSFSEIIKKLNLNKINQIVMAGSINRPSIKDIKFDINTLSLIKKYYLESKGDDKLLTIISNFFLEKGFPLFDWKSECGDLFSSKELLTTKKPTKQAQLNKDKGLIVFKAFEKADIGQSIIVQNQIILGVEASEGTNELLKRCFNYKKKGDKGILLKLTKHNQHSYLDIPTIGLNTAKLIKSYDYEGIFFERNECIILEYEKLIIFCNENNIFISGVDKID